MFNVSKMGKQGPEYSFALSRKGILILTFLNGENGEKVVLQVLRII